LKEDLKLNKDKPRFQRLVVNYEQHEVRWPPALSSFEGVKLTTVGPYVQIKSMTGISSTL
jgi:hypothetical protein